MGIGAAKVQLTTSFTAPASACCSAWATAPAPLAEAVPFCTVEKVPTMARPWLVVSFTVKATVTVGMPSATV